MSGTVQPEARAVDVITRVENSNLEKVLIKMTSQGFSQLEFFTILSFLSPLCWLVAVLFSLLFLKGLVKSWKSTVPPDASESVRCVRWFRFTILIVMEKRYPPFISSPRKRAFLTQLIYLHYIFSFLTRVYLVSGVSFSSFCPNSSQC